MNANILVKYAGESLELTAEQLVLSGMGSLCLYKEFAASPVGKRCCVTFGKKACTLEARTLKGQLLFRHTSVDAEPYFGTGGLREIMIYIASLGGKTKFMPLLSIRVSTSIYALCPKDAVIAFNVVEHMLANIQLNDFKALQIWNSKCYLEVQGTRVPRHYSELRPVVLFLQHHCNTGKRPQAKWRYTLPAEKVCRLIAADEPTGPAHTTLLYYMVSYTAVKK